MGLQKARGEVEKAESDNPLEGTRMSSRGRGARTEAQGKFQDLICMRELAGWSVNWFRQRKGMEGRLEHGHGYGETECFQRKERAAEPTTARDQVLWDMRSMQMR